MKYNVTINNVNSYPRLSKLQKRENSPAPQKTTFGSNEIKKSTWSDYMQYFINKKQLTFIIEDEDNEIFGYYLHSEIVHKMNYEKTQQTETKPFYFNLQS